MILIHVRDDLAFRFEQRIRPREVDQKLGRGEIDDPPEPADVVRARSMSSL